MDAPSPSGALTAEVSPDRTSPVSRRNLRAADWLYRSKAASVLWLVARLWLGYGWLNAGYQKLWGSESAAFWNGGGAGVKGFATAGVAGSKAGTGGASHGWFTSDWTDSSSR
jgi:thiosulfate dehydrogenase (quinone) large subunit